MTFSGWSNELQQANKDVFLPNGAGGIHIGDDAILGDRNVANTAILMGGQNSAIGGIMFGMTSANELGPILSNKATGNLYVNEEKVLTAPADRTYFPLYYITTPMDANTMVEDGIYLTKASLTNCPTTNHCVLLVCKNIGTPFQIFFPDNQPNFYKRFGLTDGQFKGQWYKSANMTAVT